MTFIDRLARSVLRKSSVSPQPVPAQRVQLDESENEFLVGTTSLNTSEFDRPQYSREDILTQCLDAWRYNPLARRITEIISQYVVGAGFAVSSSDEKTETFLQDFWSHRFNHMDTLLIELCDELTRSGNLFILISTDAGGMSYLRLIPASQIDEITTKENDLEQELAYKLKPDPFEDPISYPAFSQGSLRDPTLSNGWAKSPKDNNGSGGSLRDQATKPVVIHYAINKPAGASWGESDLSPILKWLSRYSAFLDDRVRLNRYRNAYLYVVKASYSSENTRKARQAQLALNPPTPGSILVTDESESWDVISPKLESDDAERDGLALKKMIAACPLYGGSMERRYPTALFG